MINLSDSHLLYIEPVKSPSEKPIEDNIPEMYRQIIATHGGIVNGRFRGFHTCSCNTFSDNVDWVLTNGVHYNSLGLHYLQYHREEVPQSELEKIILYYSAVKLNADLPIVDKMPLY